VLLEVSRAEQTARRSSEATITSEASGSAACAAGTQSSGTIRMVLENMRLETFKPDSIG
jgi:hypothetical protein